MQLWTAARCDLGISDREFWAITPREYFALLDRHKERERVKNYRAGLIAAAVYNVNIPEKDNRVEPLDFFEAREVRVLTSEQIEAKLNSFAALASLSSRK